MAKSVKHTDLFDTQKVSALVPDEALRKYRMAEELFRRGRERKVSITIPDPTSEIHKEISRRQTGFVRPEDLTRMRQFERPDGYDENDDDDELDDYLPYTRQVSIQPPSVTSYKTRSGFGHQDHKEKKDHRAESTQTLHGKTKQEIEKRDASGEYDVPIMADTSATVPKWVHLPSSEKKKTRESGRGGGVGWKSGSDFRTTETSDLDDNKQISDFADGKRRMSVLTRLIDDVATDQDPGPTLKYYKPLAELQDKKTLFLLTYSPEKYANLNALGDDPRELYLQRRQPITHTTRPQDQHKSIDHILGLQHGQRVYRKISTDYVRTIDQMEQKQDTSLRSLEYAKHRPAISVKEYQRQNQAYNENLERLSKLSKANVKKKQEKGKNI